MKFVAPFLLFSSLAFAQNDLPIPSRETVIAVLNGKDLTWGELDDYMKSLPPAARGAAMATRESTVHQYGMMKLLVKAAEDDKLDQKDPYKFMIEGARLQILTQGVIDYRYAQVKVPDPEVRQYYDAHTSDFQQVKLRGIYIAFVTDGKGRTEADAKTEIDRIHKQLVDGADMADLAKKVSEDEKTKASGGDFGIVKKSPTPDEIQKIAFSQKPGEIGAPLKQRNGYYIFRAENLTARPFEEVKPEVLAILTEQKMRVWLDSLNNAVSLQVKDKSFFGVKP